jgi:hypothetical protein
MSLPVARPLRPVALVLAVLLGSGCNGSSSTAPNGGAVESTVIVHVSTAASLRGLSFSLVNDSDFRVLAVVPTGALSTAQCQSNIQTTSTRDACVTTTSFSAPLDAWRLTLRHPEERATLAGITSLTCEGSDATGATFAVTCGAVEVP